MTNSNKTEISPTKCGYFPIFRYNPDTKVFTLDSKNPDFSLYEEYLETQARYNMLKAINPDKAEELLRKNKENAIARFNYYKELEEKQGNYSLFSLYCFKFFAS